MHDNLELLSMDISTAQAALEQAEADLTGAIDPRNHIAARLQQLSQERTSIVARRAGGEHYVDDGARLAAIAADTEGLEVLLRDAEGAVAGASAKCGAARSALAAAHNAYAAEEKRLTLHALDDHADRLLHLLADTLAQRNAARAGLVLEDSALHRTTARLSALDSILTGELGAIRAALPHGIPYGARPVWMPSQSLYDNTFRLRNSDGRFW